MEQSRNWKNDYVPCLINSQTSKMYIDFIIYIHTNKIQDIIMKQI